MKKNCPNAWVCKEKKKLVDTTNLVTSRDSDFESMLVVTLRESSTEEWILDSGCSYHMCPNMGLFHTLTKVNGGTVLMGNDHVCWNSQVEAAWWSSQTLSEVKYTPDLKKNLFSLGPLDSNVYKIVLKGVMTKVTSSALVLMRGKKEDNFYFLQGSTVTRSYSVSSKAGGKSTSLDSTKLWHMRLGHAG